MTSHALCQRQKHPSPHSFEAGMSMSMAYTLSCYTKRKVRRGARRMLGSPTTLAAGTMSSQSSSSGPPAASGLVGPASRAGSLPCSSCTHLSCPTAPHIVHYIIEEQDVHASYAASWSCSSCMNVLCQKAPKGRSPQQAAIQSSCGDI